jgi:osmotically-inducible protein OsmY
MNKQLAALLVFSVSAATLQGCAGLVIGGAATGASVAHDQRTAGTVLEDESIEIKSVRALRDDRVLDAQSHFNVTSYNNIVLLSGETVSQELRERAGKHVADVEKVRSVHNELKIGEPSTMLQRSADTVITTKVKTSLLSVNGIDHFDPTRVKVVTEAKVVYLMGLLKHAEADAVTETVRQVGGVERVVKIFEYTD